MTEIERQFDTLSLDAKLRLIERLVRRIRLGSIDEEAFAREMQEMANDPDMLREMNVPQGPTHAAG
jgi:hypothetical protein